MRWQRSVHPRVCGELSDFVLIERDFSGSSPRVRGTHSALDEVPFGFRFIPACAGNSATARRRPYPTAVHPRVCGELTGEDGTMGTVTGSSPRVRGTRRNALHRQRTRRFIPACAGNSTSLTSPMLLNPVHPRVCGELVAVSILPDRDSGSSPRVRGTPMRGTIRNAVARFIPACAGNSRS